MQYATAIKPKTADDLARRSTRTEPKISNSVGDRLASGGNQSVLRGASRQQQSGPPPLRPSQIPVLQRKSDRPLENGCRKVTTVPCPGTHNGCTVVDYSDTMFVENVGTCPLYLAGLDKDGNILKDPARYPDPDTLGVLVVEPGKSATYVPPTGSVNVCVGCDLTCKGSGALTRPFNCA